MWLTSFAFYSILKFIKKNIFKQQQNINIVVYALNALCFRSVSEPELSFEETNEIEERRLKREDEQIFGVAMGSPISVIVANLVMESIENKMLKDFASPPRIWLRYIDDTFVVLFL